MDDAATHALLLRAPAPEDEAVVTQAQLELAADDFEFVFRDPDEPWADYLADVERQRVGVDLAPDRVPATFLLAVVDGEIVGRVSIRHALNDRLSVIGGHIGYGVRPAYRRRGHATEILRQSLAIARGLGLDRVLLTCDDSNDASARTIESCGGVLDGVVTPEDHPPVRHYWIALA
jgi:predicted acetyltransferase